MDWFALEAKNRALENAQLLTELQFLKAQINPPFLFNTLHNLYYLAYTHSPITPEVVAQLAQIISYRGGLQPAARAAETGNRAYGLRPQPEAAPHKPSRLPWPWALRLAAGCPQRLLALGVPRLCRPLSGPALIGSWRFAGPPLRARFHSLNVFPCPLLLPQPYENSSLF
ncbi:histidine kinase [Hymenobacter tenuis]